MTNIMEDTRSDSVTLLSEPPPKNAKAHIVNPPSNTHIWRPGMTAQDIVDIARVRQIEITALCGYRWIPQQAPDDLDACDTCFEIAGILMRENGE